MNRLALVIAGVAVFAVSAFAAKQCQDFEDLLPGVEDNGNLSVLVELAGLCQCHGCINTKNGKAQLKCTGVVDNTSNANQKYKNDPIIMELFDFATKSLYKVKANGTARLTAKGVAIM